MADRTPPDGDEPLVMDKATQFDGTSEIDWYGYIRCLVKVMVVVCGLLSLYILNRMSNGTMTCTCTNEVPCLNQQSLFVRILRRVLGKEE